MISENEKSKNRFSLGAILTATITTLNVGIYALAGSFYVLPYDLIDFI